MPAPSATTGRPRTGMLLAAVAAGIVFGAGGAVAADGLSGESEHNLLFGGLNMVGGQRTEFERMTVELSVHNLGTEDFHVTDVRVPGWHLADPDAVATTIPAGHWAELSLELLVDCSASSPQLDVEMVAADGRAIVLDSDGVGPGGFSSIHLRACVEQGLTTPGATPTVDTIAARTDAEDGVIHVDVGLRHEAAPEMDFELGAVTGHASGFTIELSQRLTDLEPGATTMVTTDWRVRDCGSAAGLAGTGTPDSSSSGNFDGLVLHLYWDDPARSEPIRIDLPVDLPPAVVAELARFAVAECSTDDPGT